MRALLSLSRLARRLPGSLAAVRAAPPVLLRHLHADGTPPPPQAPPPFVSRILESDPSVTASEEPEAASDPVLDEFLARFVAAFRPLLAAAFPDHDRPVLDEMLRLVADAVVCRLTGADPGPDAVDLSDELWAAVWDVSASVRDSMRRDQVRADLRHYLHCDEVKEMTRFAVDVGIRGAMLRELRFKWAREKLEEVEFYRGLDEMRAEAEAAANPTPAPVPRLTTLPQRKGEVKFSMYGLDMSDPKWAEVAERTAEAEANFVPAEAKAVEGKAKKAEERLLSVDPRKGDPAPAMDEWKEELRPKRVDWLALLERVKTRNVELYLKVAEALLPEESFDANIQDCFKLIDLHAKASNVESAERILGKMKEKGIAPDILTSITLVHMYSKAGNLEKANEAFEFVRKEGLKPDLKLYGSIINCYINHGKPGQAESLIKSMASMGIKPTREMYMDVVRALLQCDMVETADRFFGTMMLDGIQPTSELFKLRIEAYGRRGDYDTACSIFDQMRKSGHEPDDNSVSGVMTAYMKKNLFDQALDWLLKLEKEGIKPGIKTNLVLLDWLSMLQLVLEAEQLVHKIKQLGEEPIEVHVVLADMYAKSRQEEKARKSLKILEEKKKLLKADQFERVIRGLLDGGFSEEANKYYKMMKSCGIKPSETIEISVQSSLGVRSGLRPTGRHRG
ncbi:hypothetical protein PR202_gb09045 [Eleusine coracana subsp. coracana]|uniref:Pentacotripeptide-repeat region of PRORP domain-containing protein n=1 Tax=Eleusine coracana subsp. coracana TaxID=191504 RepID=A0AAV5EFP2_ELECO|nr:hypothetical protein QOZ80_2BG0192760 [Eleusine coracana subsp. coracana]GJN21558.1 hypothetical protein PR202_gb09045 [Eleusine coracana subsp. coracana]